LRAHRVGVTAAALLRHGAARQVDWDGPGTTSRQGAAAQRIVITATKTTMSRWLRRFGDVANHVFQNHPVKANTIVSVVLCAAGDVITQVRLSVVSTISIG
jgi:N-acyl-L-homoserine lactone synthetase